MIPEANREKDRSDFRTEEFFEGRGHLFRAGKPVLGFFGQGALAEGVERFGENGVPFLQAGGWILDNGLLDFKGDLSLEGSRSDHPFVENHADEEDVDPRAGGL